MVDENLLLNELGISVSKPTESKKLIINDLKEEEKSVSLTSLTKDKIQTSNDGNFSLEHNLEEQYNLLTLEIDNFIDEAEMKRFVKNVKGLIRKTTEYSRWRDFILHVLNLSFCKLSGESTGDCACEIHHHPICMESMIYAILNKKLAKEESFTTMSIALEVLKYHYSNKVGYVTLVSSIHDKFHNGGVNININDVSGDWKLFFDEYEMFFNDDQRDTINSYMNITKSTGYYRVDDDGNKVYIQPKEDKE